MKAFIKRILEHSLPYQFVEYKKLRDLLELCNPATTLCNRLKMSVIHGRSPVQACNQNEDVHASIQCERTTICTR